MRSIFSKFALAAGIMLALVFTFSCTVDDNGGEQKCGNVVYDSDTYRCEAGELIGKCKGVDYYPAYQQCVGGVVVDGGSSSPSVSSSSSVTSGGSSSSSGSNVTPTYSLDGVWDNDGRRITVSGSTGVISAFGAITGVSQSAVDKGYITLNSTHWRNLTSTGNLTWSGEVRGITWNTSNPNVATGTSWTNATFTVSANGQTLTVTEIWGSGTSTSTFTRKQ
jgi:hypothetical protein